MALDDVSAETAVGSHGKFEIDQIAFVNARERSTLPGFGGEVGAEQGGLDVEGGQTHAADRDAVAGLEFFGDMIGGDGDAAVFAALLDAGDASYFFDNAGEHECLQEILIRKY